MQRRNGLPNATKPLLEKWYKIDLKTYDASCKQLSQRIKVPREYWSSNICIWCNVNVANLACIGEKILCEVMHTETSNKF